MNAPAARQAFAHARVGRLRFAVPARHVRRALDLPPELVRLPARQDNGLMGVFRHQDQTVPLLDLSHWMRDRSQALASDRPLQVLLVGSGPRQAGLAIDALGGVITAGEAAVHRLGHGAGDDFFHSVLVPRQRSSATDDPDASQPTPLLDADVLLDLARFWHEAGDAPGHADRDQSVQAVGHAGGPVPVGSAEPAAQATGASAGVLHARFDCAGQTFALPASDVAELLPMPALAPMSMSPASLLGIARWRGRDVSVIHLARLLGLPGGGTGARAPWLMVVRHDQGVVGLPVEQLDAVAHLVVTADAVGPGPAWLGEDLIRGTLYQGSRACHLLRVGGLMSHAPLSHLGVQPAAHQAPLAGRPRPAAAGSSGAADAPAGAADAGGFLTFRAGQDMALAIDQVQAVLAWPDALERSPRPGDTIVGQCEWQGRSLPLCDLRMALGLPPLAPGADVRVLVVRAAGEWIGLAVERLYSVLAPGRVSGSRLTKPNGTAIDMITTTGTGQARSFRLLCRMNLESLGKSLRDLNGLALLPH